jgi:hypothetical protein
MANKNAVSFEIIGMLGKVLRIRGSSFRMIPNPTGDQWLKKIGHKASWRITRLMEIFNEKLKALVLENYLESIDEIEAIIERWEKISRLGRPNGSIENIYAKEAVHDALDQTTDFLLSLTQAEVLSVLVAHISQVAQILDDPNSPLNTIVLANKEDSLLTFYFDKIRPRVVGEDSKEPNASMDEINQRNIIWISLIFRMLCWLSLHDFNKADVMIVPSDLKGSRMPVYIG